MRLLNFEQFAAAQLNLLYRAYQNINEKIVIVKNLKREFQLPLVPLNPWISRASASEPVKLKINEHLKRISESVDENS